MAPSSYNGSNAGNYGNRAKILARSCSFHGQTNAENNVHRRALVTFYNGRCNGAAPNAIYTDCVMRSLRYIAGLQFRFTLAESIYGIRQNRAYAHIILWNIYTPSIALTRTLYLGPSMLAFFHVCSSAICIMKRETLYYLAWNVYSCRATVSESRFDEEIGSLLLDMMTFTILQLMLHMSFIILPQWSKQWKKESVIVEILFPCQFLHYTSLCFHTYSYVYVICSSTT